MNLAACLVSQLRTHSTRGHVCFEPACVTSQQSLPNGVVISTAAYVVLKFFLASGLDQGLKNLLKEPPNCWVIVYFGDKILFLIPNTAESEVGFGVFSLFFVNMILL